MKKVAFLTLGCKVNTYESEAMLKLFCDAGYENCVTIADINTVINMAIIYPLLIKEPNITKEIKLKKSPKNINFLGLYLSAIIPPKKVNKNIGTISTKFNDETAIGSLFVTAIIKNITDIFLIQIAACCIISVTKIVVNTVFFNKFKILTSYFFLHLFIIKSGVSLQSTIFLFLKLFLRSILLYYFVLVKQSHTLYMHLRTGYH